MIFKNKNNYQMKFLLNKLEKNHKLNKNIYLKT